MTKKKVIHLHLSRKSINKAIREVEGYRYWIERKCHELVDRLAKEGVYVARIRFETAQYDGTNDAIVYDTSEGYTVAKVKAIGNSVLFIEFGTGVYYADEHPEAAENGMIRGEYGAGHGKNENGWVYEGDPGTYGQPVTVNGVPTGRVHTFGNPANMPMYLATTELRTKFADIAREVFGL